MHQQDSEPQPSLTGGPSDAISRRKDDDASALKPAGFQPSGGSKSLAAAEALRGANVGSEGNSPDVDTVEGDTATSSSFPASNPGRISSASTAAKSKAPFSSATRRVSKSFGLDQEKVVESFSDRKIKKGIKKSRKRSLLKRPGATYVIDPPRPIFQYRPPSSTRLLGSVGSEETRNEEAGEGQSVVEQIWHGIDVVMQDAFSSDGSRSERGLESVLPGELLSAISSCSQRSGSVAGKGTPSVDTNRIDNTDTEKEETPMAKAVLKSFTDNLLPDEEEGQTEEEVDEEIAKLHRMLQSVSQRGGLSQTGPLPAISSQQSVEGTAVESNEELGLDEIELSDMALNDIMDRLLLGLEEELQVIENEGEDTGKSPVNQSCVTLFELFQWSVGVNIDAELKRIEPTKRKMLEEVRQVTEKRKEECDDDHAATSTEESIGEGEEPILPGIVPFHEDGRGHHIEQEQILRRQSYAVEEGGEYSDQEGHETRWASFEDLPATTARCEVANAISREATEESFGMSRSFRNLLLDSDSNEDLDDGVTRGTDDFLDEEEQEEEHRADPEMNESEWVSFSPKSEKEDDEVPQQQESIQDSPVMPAWAVFQNLPVIMLRRASTCTPGSTPGTPGSGNLPSSFYDRDTVTSSEEGEEGMQDDSVGLQETTLSVARTSGNANGQDGTLGQQHHDNRRAPQRYSIVDISESQAGEGPRGSKSSRSVGLVYPRIVPVSQPDEEQSDDNGVGHVESDAIVVPFDGEARTRQQKESQRTEDDYSLRSEQSSFRRSPSEIQSYQHPNAVRWNHIGLDNVIARIDALAAAGRLSEGGSTTRESDGRSVLSSMPSRRHLLLEDDQVDMLSELSESVGRDGVSPQPNALFEIIDQWVERGDDFTVESLPDSPSLKEQTKRYYINRAPSLHKLGSDDEESISKFTQDFMDCLDGTAPLHGDSFVVHFPPRDEADDDAQYRVVFAEDGTLDSNKTDADQEEVFRESENIQHRRLFRVFSLARSVRRAGWHELKIVRSLKTRRVGITGALPEVLSSLSQVHTTKKEDSWSVLLEEPPTSDRHPRGLLRGFCPRSKGSIKFSDKL